MFRKLVFPSYYINCDKKIGDRTLQGPGWVLFNLVLGFIGTREFKVFGNQVKAMHIFACTGIAFEDEAFGIVGRSCRSKGSARGSTIGRRSATSSRNGGHCTG